MDAQSRGRGGDIDPADQWVLNPDTGDYELRLNHSAPQRPVPSPRRPRSSGGGPDGGAGAKKGSGSAGDPDAPRGRTGAPGRTAERPAGRRAAERRTPEREGTSRRRRDVPEEPAAGRRGRRPAKKKSKAKKALLWTGGTMAFVVLATAVGGYLYLEHLNGNINSVSDDGASTGGFQKDKAINILLIGTDKRTGSGNEGYGDAGSAGHADTTLLLHVSKDRTNATALSIPRDLIVDIPDCPTRMEDGTEKTIPGSRGRFNTSLGQNERTPSCTMRTVTELTGITPDNFMVADFNAVKTLTTAVGGVEVCLAEDVNDKDSKLNLSAGTHTIEGEEALAFVRTRHAWGNQGDLDRIKVQQQFLGALMRQLKSSDTLTSPTKMVKLAEAGTEALTVDSQLDSINKLKDLGLELGKLNIKNLAFITLPVKDNPAETVRATVVVDDAKAPEIFELIKNDVSFTEVKQQEKKEKAAVAARLKGTKAPASDVRVRVLNGGGPSGSAQETVSWLQLKEGVSKSENSGNADETLEKTTLEYAPDQAAQARRLADILGLSGSGMKPGESVTNSQGLPTMTLTLGEDFKGAGVPLTPPSKASDDIKKSTSTADKVECAQ
ncbi:LCP family protein [Streptomyces prasinopilosus]|uniref:Transcriptional attenuator, LytR family n=1 Tax=Streptomyces prasinopilosus TaxID=67344 RepID=A0A1G6RBM0_9ACTN|nr:LCP family protein [Streptomyces prasinopilosus]SDD02019.1 transcriptional attenuator, LytR family [Streptomyces prasinopilosus]